MASVNIVAEGDTDLPALTKVVVAAGHDVGRFVIATRGKSKLDAKLGSYLHAAMYETNGAWLIVRDLDTDAPCAPQLVAQLLSGSGAAGQPPHGALRIAERAIEAWALADRQAFASFYQVPVGSVPWQPDTEIDPKALLVRLATRSRSGPIRRRVPPTSTGGRRVGPEYEAYLIEYFRTCWRPDQAAANSPSLARALRHLERFV